MAPVATFNGNDNKNNDDSTIEKLKTQAQAQNQSQAPYNPFYSPHRDGDDGDDDYEYARYKV